MKTKEENTSIFNGFYNAQPANEYDHAIIPEGYALI